MNYEDFEKKGLENLGIMEDTGFLKKQGYGKNFGWKVVATVLGVLVVGVMIFIGYCIYDGKFQFNANPNILCESQVCELTCPEHTCICNGTVTCEPAQVNITINQPVWGV